MKNIHILPTDNYKEDYKLQNSDAVIQVVRLGQLIFDSSLKEFRINKNNSWAASCDTDVLIPHNIYITSDVEIKEGEYYIHGNRLHKHLGRKCLDVLTNKEYTQSSLINKDFVFKKIILTTDGDLIKAGVQAPDDEFLEWFVKNPRCEEIEIKKEYITPLGDIVETCYDNERLNYKIIIPKEEQTDMMKSDDEEPKKDYSGLHLRHCYQGKHKDGCKYGKDDCPAKPKQETLEEAAEKYSKRSSASVFQEAHKRDFIEGAKWKQEQDKNKYSEEEVGELIYNIIGEYGKYYGIMIDGNKLNNLFEQYKKK